MRVVASTLSCILLATSGCTSLPNSGPTSSQVKDQAVEKGQHQFDLVEITPSVVDVLARGRATDFRAVFSGSGKPPVATIQVGDTLGVSIYEQTGIDQTTAPGGAGGEAPQPAGPRLLSLPEQTVSADGSIRVPFAGRVDVIGKTEAEISIEVEQRLASQLVQPQVLVTAGKSLSQTVTVEGEDITGGRMAVSKRGERILDVIAQAGGTKSASYDVLLRLTRDGRTATTRLSDVIADPEENIFVWPGDVLTLDKRPDNFLVFGATTVNAQIPFGNEKLNLAQALAKAGGLQDQRADSAGIFLFRLGPAAKRAAPAATDAAASTLYHLNLHQVRNYFLAEQFPMQSGDILYIANAPLTELQKFFTLISTITGPVISGAVLTKQN